MNFPVCKDAQLVMTERQGIEIERPDLVELRLSLGGLDRFCNGLHRDAFPYIFVARGGPCFPADAWDHTGGG